MTQERRWIQSRTQSRPDRGGWRSFRLASESGATRPLLRLSLRLLLASAILTSAGIWGDDLVRGAAAVTLAAHREVVAASDGLMAEIGSWFEPSADGYGSAPFETPVPFAPAPPQESLPAAALPFPDYYSQLFPAGWVALEDGSICPADTVGNDSVCNFLIPPPGDEWHEYYLRMYAQQRGIPLPPPFGPPLETPPISTPIPIPTPEPDPYAGSPASSSPQLTEGSGAGAAAANSGICPPGQVPLVYLVESPPGSGAGAGGCVYIGDYCETVNSQAPGAIGDSGRCDGSVDTGGMRETTHELKSLLQDMNILPR